MEESKKTKTPWHLWLVGTVAVLFNGMGSYDYVMTKTGNEEYLKEVAEFTQEQIDFFANFPVWATALWAVGVWGGVLGGFLLLLKKSLSVQVLLISFIASTASMSYMYIFSNGMEVVGSAGNITFAAVIIVLEYAFFHYARAMRQKGFLG